MRHERQRRLAQENKTAPALRFFAGVAWTGMVVP
jgi:hypothetical protein